VVAFAADPPERRLVAEAQRDPGPGRGCLAFRGIRIVRNVRRPSRPPPLITEVRISPVGPFSWDLAAGFASGLPGLAHQAADAEGKGGSAGAICRGPRLRTERRRKGGPNPPRCAVEKLSSV